METELNTEINQGTMTTTSRSMGDSSFNQQVGDALRSIRETRGFEQKTIAELVGMNQSWPSKMESGRNEVKMSSIYRYLRAMGADWTDFAEYMGWI